MVQIECKDLCLGFEGQVVVDKLNFVVEKGDYLCVIGENGSGKTTLMKTLLGLNKPIKGEIVFGEELKHKQIGYLPQQNTLQKDFPATNEEIVLSGFVGKNGLNPFYAKKMKTEAIENMKKMGVYEFRNRPFSSLSGGQQQRVLLARALCATKDILLLDEPVSSLDRNSTLNMYELIKELNNEGITIIMITHDLEDVIDDASHILHIGKNLYFKSKENYIKEMQNA